MDVVNEDNKNSAEVSMNCSLGNIEIENTSVNRRSKKRGENSEV